MHLGFMVHMTKRIQHLNLNLDCTDCGYGGFLLDYLTWNPSTNVKRA